MLPAGFIGGVPRVSFDRLPEDLGQPAGATLEEGATLRDRLGTGIAAQIRLNGSTPLSRLVAKVMRSRAGTEVADLDHDEVRRMLDQHLWTTLNILQAAIPGMRARGYGRLIGVSTPFASTPGPRGAAYAIAKSSVELLLRTAAREVAAAPEPSPGAAATDLMSPRTFWILLAGAMIVLLGLIVRLVRTA